jgi:aspartate/methionine/tyrosine aminotransferase
VINSLEYIPVEIKTSREENYLITVQKLAECKEEIAGILIASPNNPTGSMYDSQSLKELSAYCEEMGIYILSDELYHGITFSGKAESVLKYNAHATIVNGFSKYFAMTGWRLGWMVVPEADVSRYESLLQNLILCTSTLTQMAAVKAFSAYDELDKHVSYYKQNIDILHHSLSDLGLSINKPDGAFYLYVELDDVKFDSMAFCKKLLSEKQVAASPGMDFSSKLNNCAIRLSVCQPQDVIAEAANRLKDFINTHI